MLRIEAPPLDQLPAQLPHWLGSLSLARGQIIVDQIRSVIEQSAEVGSQTATNTNRIAVSPAPGSPVRPSVPKPLIWLNAQAEPEKGTDSPILATIIAVQNFSGRSGHLGDSATVILASDSSPTANHDDSGDGVGPPADELAFQQLANAFEQELRRRNVAFVQWATDPIDLPNKPTTTRRQIDDSPTEATKTAVTELRQHQSLRRCCDAMAMEPLATLQYMCGRLDEISVSVSPAETESGMSLRPIQWDSDQETGDFERLVTATYQDTRDCPVLCQHRSAAQTLAGYQAASSFDANRWYWVFESPETGPISTNKSNAVERPPAGCLIMASHSAKTSELVYMALVPDARNRGLGKKLIAAAVDESNGFANKNRDRTNKQTNANETDLADQLVLAVDQQNSRAHRLYQRAGFRPILRETVWGKSIGPSESS